MNTKIAKILTFIKNISYFSNSKKQIKIKFNNTILSLIKSLYLEGFILSFTILENKILFIKLRIFNGVKLTNNIKMIVKKNNSHSLKNKILSCFIQGIKKEYFISTNKGIKTGNYCKKLQLGGFPLFSC